MTRRADIARHTKETQIDGALVLDGAGVTDVSTGLPFFDHMIHQLGRHGRFDLSLHARGDLDVDAHHTVEDVGLALGEGLRAALGDKAGIRRFGSALLPLDEALVEVALDLSGRPFLVYDVPLPEGAQALGTPPFEPHLIEHFWQSLSTAAGITLHISLRRGHNVHHILEAAFKGTARALADAVRIDGGGVPSTKGSL